MATTAATGTQACKNSKTACSEAIAICTKEGHAAKSRHGKAKGSRGGWEGVRVMNRVAGALHPVHDAVEGHAVGVVGVNHVEGVKAAALGRRGGSNHACTYNFLLIITY